MWEPIWASRFRYWLLTGDVSRSCLHSSRTRRVRTLKIRWRFVLWVYVIWWPKFVRSPGWDRGHDEESQNGWEVKIDILVGYIRTLERFWVIRVFFGVPESYGNSYWALMGHTGKERKASRVAAPLPHGLVRIGLGKGGAPFLPSPSPFPFSYSMWEVESY
jgi:hypothetical protein